MKNYQRDFIQFALEQNALKFGEFTLKSGRLSPYFFNMGCFDTGMALAKLAYFYAKTIVERNISFDGLFGPAYKGIPLVASVAIVLATEFGIDKPYSFNRKEEKDHGEGGVIVGAPLKGRILMIDDVITAGTAVNHSVNLIHSMGAELAGVLIALDRQEKGQNNISAIAEISQRYQTQVYSIISFNDLMDYLQSIQNYETKKQLENYRAQYGVELNS